MKLLTDFLREVPLFSALSDDHLAHLSMMVAEIGLAEGEVLFNEGEPGDKMYIIKEGQIEILKHSPDGDRVIATREPGSVIGEMSLLDQSPRVATVRAGVPTTLLAIEQAAFDALLDNIPSVARAILRTVTPRWSETTKVLQANEAALQKMHDELSKQMIQLERRVVELSSLSRITQIISITQDLEQSLNNVVREITTLYDAINCSIALLNDSNTELKVVAEHSTNVNHETLVGATFPITDATLAAQVVANKKLAVNRDIPSQPVRSPLYALFGRLGIKTNIVAPLITHGEVIGILSISRGLEQPDYTENDTRLAETISGQIANGIENSRLLITEQILRQAAESANRQLSEKNDELNRTLETLQATQQELIQAEKMAALGQLVAGVAHEVNTPLGAIRASINNITKALENSITHLPRIFQTLSAERQADFFELVRRSGTMQTTLSSREARRKRRALQQQLTDYDIREADSMAYMLVNMGVYEDIELFIPLLSQPDAMFVLQAAYNLSVQQNNSKNIEMATEKAGKVVFALKRYVHHDPSGEKIEADITEGLEVVLTIYHNQLKQGVEVVRQYEPIPKIKCYPDELNQVWTNLIHNAIQAMGQQGRLLLRVYEQDNQVNVAVQDNGPGIPLEIQEQIFEPFFTTKQSGEGSGLGLDIARKIIQKHDGRIAVESQVGQTTFTVSLPIN